MRQGVRTVTLTNLMPVKRRNGHVAWYLRRKGHKLVPLPDLPHDDPAFVAAWAAAMEATGPVRELRLPPGSIAGLTEAAMASDRFLSRSAVYRATLRRHFEAIRQTAGTAPAKGLRDKHVRADVTRAASPADRLKAWRFLCAFGVDAGLLDLDPTQGVKLAARPRTTGHMPWTADEIDRFRARWTIGTAKRLAFEVLHWTGLRIGDAVNIGPGHVDRRGVLVFSQSKVKESAFIPWRGALPAWAADGASDRAMMHQALESVQVRHMTFLATAQGAARSDKALGNMIREAARSAGVEKSAHGLRKTRGIALAEGGASAHQIMSWLGHQTLKEAEHYTRLANRRRAVMGAEQERNGATHAAQGATRDAGSQ